MKCVLLCTLAIMYVLMVCIWFASSTTATDSYAPTASNSSNEHFASELTTRATASYMRRHMLDNVPNVTCNDGTNAGYYIRQNYNSQRWLIFLEGGWHCFNEKSCQQRWLRMKHFMTSKHWPELKNGEGILSSNPADNPHWWDANHVFVPYCSSDSWSGDSVASSPAQLSFMGSRILDEVINSLLMRDNGLKQARFVLLAGSSAGAAGVIVNLDRIADMIHASVLEHHNKLQRQQQQQQLQLQLQLQQPGNNDNSTQQIMANDNGTTTDNSGGGGGGRGRGGNNHGGGTDEATNNNKSAMLLPEVRGLADSGWFLDNEPFDLLEQQQQHNSNTPLEVAGNAGYGGNSHQDNNNTSNTSNNSNNNSNTSNNNSNNNYNNNNNDDEQACDEPHACAPVQSIKLAMRMWNGRVPKACKEQYSNESWRCYFGYRAFETLKTPLFVVQWLFDQAQLMVDNVGRPETASQWNYVHKMSAQLRATLENVPAVFAPSCFSHTILTKSDWFRIKVNEVSLSQALDYWESQRIKPRTFVNSNERDHQTSATSTTNNQLINLSDLRPSAYRLSLPINHNQNQLYHSTLNHNQTPATTSIVPGGISGNQYQQSDSSNSANSFLITNNNRLTTTMQSESGQARLHPYNQAMAQSQHNRKRGNKGKKRKPKNSRNKLHHNNINNSNNNNANYTNNNAANLNAVLLNNNVKSTQPDLSLDHLMNRNEMNQHNLRHTRTATQQQNPDIRSYKRRKSSSPDRRTNLSNDEITHPGNNNNKQNMWLVDSCTWPQCNQECPSMQNV